MTDRYVMDLHDRTLEEQDNFIERNAQSRTSGSSQQTTIGDDQQSADEPEPTPGQLAEENQSENMRAHVAYKPQTQTALHALKM